MFALSFTVCEIISRNVHDLDLDLLKTTNVKCKYANQMDACDFLCVGNSNVCPMCHRFAR